MANATTNIFYKIMNWFTKWPSRGSILQTAARYEKLQKDAEDIQASHDVGGHRLVSQYCCVLYWDESTGRSDEPITVSSESVCKKTAEDNNANYRKPIIHGPCAGL